MSSSPVLLPVAAQGCELGCDLSHHNDDPEFHALLAAGVRRVHLKATQGTDYRDPTYQDRRARALSVGLRVGSYHFFDPRADAIEQAQAFLHALGKLDPRELSPVVDVEEAKGWDALSRDHRAAAVVRFIETVMRGTGRLVHIYTSMGWWNGLFDADLSRYPLWLAHYGAQPGPTGKWKQWEGWQFTDKGTLPSLAKGTVDLSAWRVGK